MKYLVTGADGYIGLGVIDELRKRGDEVVATDIHFRHEKRKDVTYIAANIFDMEDPYKNLGRPDVMIHLAWRDGFKHASNAHMEDLSSHYCFVINMYQGGLRHIVALGSMHEIGYFEGKIDENTITNPMSLYGVAKNALREALTIYFKDKEEAIFQWIRGYYIVKNTIDGCSIFSKIVQAEKEGKSKFPFTTGKNKYDFVEYEDFCKQIAMVAGQEKYVGCINCCSGIPVSLADRVERFIAENKFNIELEYGVFPDRPYDSPAIWGDAEIIKKIEELYE